ncbi:MAG TPA: RNA polymerase sigma-70 factor [Chitinophagaceae bacterium]|nr:RNA polymerase sigma-70 factor [Chitinophagaceae bacterium]
MPKNAFEATYETTFKSIFDTYKDRLYGYVLAVSHSTYTAEEITQEIFMKLWLCRDMLASIDNIEGYIFTIARNKTLNHLRKASNQASLLQEIQSRMKPAVNANEERTAVTELEKLVHDALTLLSPQRRLVYQLSRHKGLDHGQIAQQLHLSRNTVKNHLVHSLRFIRNYLGQHGAVSLIFILCNLFRNL